VAATGVDKQIRVWDANSGAVIKLLSGHKDDVYRVQFNPAGNRLLSAGYSGQLNVWDIGTGQPVFQTKLPAIIYSAAYLPNGQRAAATANDGNTYLVDIPEAAR
jgi:WD40 repeat protein